MVASGFQMSNRAISIVFGVAFIFGASGSAAVADPSGVIVDADRPASKVQTVRSPAAVPGDAPGPSGTAIVPLMSRANPWPIARILIPMRQSPNSCTIWQTANSTHHWEHEGKRKHRRILRRPELRAAVDHRNEG
jgi:hypothetical protein